MGVYAVGHTTLTLRARYLAAALAGGSGAVLSHRAAAAHWGFLADDGTLRLFRGAKLRLVDVDPDLIEQALRPGHTLTARIRLTDVKGNPICARVHPPYLTWSVTGP